ncbi:hypothetical protein ISS07_01405 [Candidatus Woesearchaeota archaeon]|nr:hypothetical protein [Candidatus Woesearchaeota archaeon]
MTKEALLSILLLSAAFILVFGVAKLIVDEAEDKTTESICKGSVVLREKTHQQINDPTGNIELASVSSPLLCKTIDRKIPESKEADEEQVKKEFSKMMTSCWSMFGEGLIKDVFKQGDPFTNNCFVCYTANLRETKNFREKNSISSQEFLQYLFSENYKIEGKGFSCEENKGECRENNPDTSKYVQHKSWKCKERKESCFVEKSRYYSYGEYMQDFGGEGKIIITEDIRPGETYTISFGSETDKCDICETIGIGSGIGASLGVIVWAASGPVGWIVGGTAAGIVGIATYLGVSEGSKIAAVSMKDLFSEREFPTIYLSTLKQLNEGDFCSVVTDIQD